MDVTLRGVEKLSGLVIIVSGSVVDVRCQREQTYAYAIEVKEPIDYLREWGLAEPYEKSTDTDMPSPENNLSAHA